MSQAWHFDTDLDGWVGSSVSGWVVPSIPAHVIWDNSQYHDNPGSVLFNVDGWCTLVYSTSLACQSGDVLSCWIRPTTASDDDSGRELTLLIQFSDSTSRWLKYDFSSLPMDVWTQFSVAVQPDDVGKTITSLVINYDSGWIGDAGGYIDNVKAWIDDIEFTSSAPVTTTPYIQKTTDGGDNWINITPTVSGDPVGVMARRGLHINDLNQNQITALMRVGDYDRLYQSLDGGMLWSELNPTDLNGAVAIGRWPYNSVELYLGDNNHWYWSIDNGATLLDKTGDWGSISVPSNIVPVFLGGG